MAFYRVYPRQPEYYPSREVIAEAILSGLSRGMNDLNQLLGPYHRARGSNGPCCEATKQGVPLCTRASQKQSSQIPHKRAPTLRDPPAAWVWWMLGGEDSSDSEEESQTPATSKHSRGRPACSEESCAIKRKPSRSASNAPPSKKKEEKKSDEEETPKFNFTGRKTAEKSKCYGSIY